MYLSCDDVVQINSVVASFTVQTLNFKCMSSFLLFFDLLQISELDEGKTQISNQHLMMTFRTKPVPIRNVMKLGLETKRVPSVITRIAQK